MDPMVDSRMFRVTPRILRPEPRYWHSRRKLLSERVTACESVEDFKTTADTRIRTQFDASRTGEHGIPHKMRQGNQSPRSTPQCTNGLIRPNFLAGAVSVHLTGGVSPKLFRWDVLFEPGCRQNLFPPRMANIKARGVSQVTQSFLRRPGALQEVQAHDWSSFGL
jgi:hypothetical protein